MLRLRDPQDSLCQGPMGIASEHEYHPGPPGGLFGKPVVPAPAALKGPACGPAARP